MKKVLVAEDEESIREFIVINLSRSGYTVEQAENGLVALQKFKQDEEGFDVAILDIMMPELDGLAVCKELRKLSSDLGIIMLSAKTQEMDKVTGLLFGADDYVTKPFSPSELMARVDAIYRRVEMTRGFKKGDANADSIVLDEFELNLRNRTLLKSGNMIELTQVEFQIIEYFFRNPNAALSRNDILKQVWGANYFGDEKIVDCIEQLKDYAEDSIPVLDDNKHILGVITAHDIVEVVDEELGEDYAKLGGLTAEEDLNETTLQSTKKRLPWLIILLFLGMGVSSVVGMFETVVAVIPIVICFQSLILDMAGNVGTQSLAVTIRVLMDENLKASDKVKLMFKEVRVGFSNGLLLGTMSFIFVGLYIFLFKGNTFGYSFLVSGCVGFSLLASMVISSLVGTLVPMFFSKIKVDPAVASGPLITTINDLVAVVTYYGMVWIFLIDIFKLA